MLTPVVVTLGLTAAAMVRCVGAVPRPVDLSMDRDAFMRAHPYPFLVPCGPPAPGDQDDEFVDGPTVRVAPDTVRAALAAVAGPRLPLPVTKSTPLFPHMLTVGRTPNNDVVLAQADVSKFHAYFEVTAEGLTLADAGSANGTWVNDARLSNKDQPHPVRMGDKVRFGELTFEVLDAASCWDSLRMNR